MVGEIRGSVKKLSCYMGPGRVKGPRLAGKGHEMG